MDIGFPKKNTARSKSRRSSIIAKKTSSALAKKYPINLPPYGKSIESTQKKGNTIKKSYNLDTNSISKKDSTKLFHIENRLELLEKKVNMLENSLNIAPTYHTRSKTRSRRRDTLESIERQLMQNSSNIENRHLFPGAIFDAIDKNDTDLLKNILSENSSALNEERDDKHPLEYAVKKGNLPIIKILVNATPKDQNLDEVINLVLNIQTEKEGTQEEFKYADIYRYLILSKKNRSK